jgi:hypothetical protein
VIDRNIGNQNGFVFPTTGGVGEEGVVVAVPQPGGGMDPGGRRGGSGSDDSRRRHRPPGTAILRKPPIFRSFGAKSLDSLARGMVESPPPSRVAEGGSSWRAGWAGRGI